MTYIYIDPFGRKIAILTAASTFVVGSIIQVIAPSVGAMMAGRFLGGSKYTREYRKRGFVDIR